MKVRARTGKQGDIHFPSLLLGFALLLVTQLIFSFFSHDAANIPMAFGPVLPKTPVFRPEKWFPQNVFLARAGKPIFSAIAENKLHFEKELPCTVSMGLNFSRKDSFVHHCWTGLVHFFADLARISHEFLVWLHPGNIFPRKGVRNKLFE